MLKIDMNAAQKQALVTYVCLILRSARGGALHVTEVIPCEFDRFPDLDIPEESGVYYDSNSGWFRVRANDFL